MKWVTTWSNAISIADAKPEGYAKDITLRYPILNTFDGNKIRIKLDNFTGKEKVHFEKVTIAKTTENQNIDESTLKTILFSQKESIDLDARESIYSDDIEFNCRKGESISISIYLNEFTSMRAGVTTMGPLTKAYYALGNQSENNFDIKTSKEIQWFYFLSDVDIYTSNENQAIVCFGDSITAQAWCEYLQLKLLNTNLSFPRKAVSGARVLRQYDCITYEAYGLKSEARFLHDISIPGSDKVIVLEGVNDLIHPVGTDVNIFRPITDLPTASELINGYRNLIKIAKENHKKIYIGTILPFKGWRTYASFREALRQEVNDWIRTTDEMDGCIDFDQYMRNPEDSLALLPLYDSGDHLHPSLKGYEQMADIVIGALKEYAII